VSADRGVELREIGADQMLAQNVAAEVSERTAVTKYPRIYAYCTKVVNDLREKFRLFSGEAQMVIEVRVSQDRLECIEDQLQMYVDAVTQMLDASRGDWGDGTYYAGEYEITFTSVKQGGRNFIQTAKVSFPVEVSAG
jgi:hypothetical protein